MKCLVTPTSAWCVHWHGIQGRRDGAKGQRIAELIPAKKGLRAEDKSEDYKEKLPTRENDICKYEDGHQVGQNLKVESARQSYS
jgi:hypothetical protein